MMKTKPTLPFFLFLTIVLVACAPSVAPNATTSPPPAPVNPTYSILPTISPPTANHEIEFISNNQIHLLPIHADLKTAAQIEIPLAGKPVWVAGIPFETGSAWAVTLEDGSIQAFLVDINDYAQTAISPNKLPKSTPLTIYSQAGQLFALTSPDADASPLTEPILIDSSNLQKAYIATDGDLVIWQNGQEIRLPADALPDSRILTDGQGRLLLLSNPTERYTHGVLGDELEAAGITLVETNPEPSIVQTISIPEPDVIEGIYPIWADLNNDGKLEIIVTLSNAQSGARIAAFHEDGRLLAEGPAVGMGFRWRHQLVVAPFGDSRENLLAVVRTPHIGGIVEFYRLNGDKLEIVSQIPGVSTHSIGSRNLFTAQAGDFDNDGQVELLAPDQSHTRLGIVGIDGESITWLNLDAELVTNLAAITFPDSDNVVLAAGLSNNTLRIWLP